ncbi:MAG: extracellular solute-binding protein [Lachnospiraceae bacterium]|nr:extracellular solute-binding protein [Lachnospiraceae bacterium]
MAKRNTSRRLMATGLSAALVLSSFTMASAQTSLTLEEFEDIIGTYNIDESIVSYEVYAGSHEDKTPSSDIVIDARDYVRFTDGSTDDAGNDVLSDPEVKTDYSPDDSGHYIAGDAVLTKESGFIEYDVEVKETGWYYLSINYIPVEGSSSSIERSFFIDGELPYQEAADVLFDRVYTNEVTETYTDANGVELLQWEVDNQGNDLKPSLIEAPEWMESYLYDQEGYVTTELGFYLEAGTHTLSIVSLREPMLIRQLKLGQLDNVPTYAEKLAQWEGAGASNTSGKTIRIEAENASKTSSQMLYPVQDQSSPAVYPSSAKELKNNSIGGNSWRLTGQWIEWEFDVEETGFYNITLFDKQNFVRGIYVSRKISIDGEVPFEEFSDYGFNYSQNWRTETLSDADGNAYKIYLEAGSHTIRMEVVLGDFSEIISDVQDIVTELNAVYRNVIRITGVSPDADRDYEIEDSLPELPAKCKELSDRLNVVIDTLRAVAGKGSDKETVLITMADELEELSEDVEDFSKTIDTFKINVRACGNWITQVLDQPLQIDTIYIVSPTEEVKVAHTNWFESLLYELERLFFSFIIDYNQVGNVADASQASEAITLWIGTGRDQANVIKAMIDETFTNDLGIPVNVMLVDVNTLLQATLAGQGPDVAIQVNNDVPMNYGIRNAVIDLSQFSDLDEVLERFNYSAYRAFQFNGATYALPETQTYLMMYYRKDILAEIGLEVPKTWDDVKIAMAVLNQNQMEFGMLPQEQVFDMFLYQTGGEYYNEDGSLCILDNDEGVNAFKEYCAYYTDYTLDKETTVEQRFRTGEAPIIIGDISLYNNFQVSAPDIKGLWGMAAVPGTPVDTDGDGETDDINISSGSAGTACVIMSKTENPNSCWEFLKWWTSSATQVQYSREMEALMGSSARVATANNDAFVKLSWPTSDLDTLLEQRQNLLGIPQVPGSYFTWRNINNAFYSVTTETDTVSPREELMDKILLINEEIEFKRAEFGLD